MIEYHFSWMNPEQKTEDAWPHMDVISCSLRWLETWLVSTLTQTLSQPPDINRISVTQSVLYHQVRDVR